MDHLNMSPDSVSAEKVANTLIAFGGQLISILESSSFVDVPGAGFFSRRIQTEVGVLRKGLKNTNWLKFEHVQSSNLFHYGAVILMAKALGEKVVSLNHKFRDEDQLAWVDIVSNGGLTWVKVVCRCPNHLQFVHYTGGKNDKTSSKQAEQFHKLAATNTVLYTKPKVVFVFCRGVSESLCADLTKSDVLVLTPAIIPDERLRASRFCSSQDGDSSTDTDCSCNAIDDAMQNVDQPIHCTNASESSEEDSETRDCDYQKNWPLWSQEDIDKIGAQIKLLFDSRSHLALNSFQYRNTSRKDNKSNISSVGHTVKCFEDTSCISSLSNKDNTVILHEKLADKVTTGNYNEIPNEITEIFHNVDLSDYKTQEINIISKTSTSILSSAIHSQHQSECKEKESNKLMSCNSPRRKIESSRMSEQQQCSEFYLKDDKDLTCKCKTHFSDGFNVDSENDKNIPNRLNNCDINKYEITLATASTHSSSKNIISYPMESIHHNNISATIDNTPTVTHLCCSSNSWNSSEKLVSSDNKCSDLNSKTIRESVTTSCSINDTASCDNEKNVVWTNKIENALPSDRKYVYLDVSCMIAYVSNICNGHNNVHFGDSFLASQSQREREAPLKPVIEKLWEGAVRITSSEAVKRLLDISTLMSGPQEQTRINHLLHSTIELPDHDLLKDKLELCRGVSESSRLIFGTALYYKCPIITANRRFLRSANSQGIDIAALVHDPRALTEKKQYEIKSKTEKI